MANPAKHASVPHPEAAPLDRAHVPMTEEFDSAKWTLPPVVPVVAALLGLALLVGIVTYSLRPKPVASGSIDEVFATAPDDSSVLATIKVTLHNTSQKPLWIRNIKAKLSTDKGDWEDEAASAVDFERYFSAFPSLKEHSSAPLQVETKIPPGASADGTVIVSFPVTVDQFNQRKSIMVTVEPYDQRAVVIRK